MQTHFKFIPGWYRQSEEVRDIARHYYFILRSVLHNQSHLRQYLSRCAHCRIFFITHPCNAGRTDLGCPFGCSQAHRKSASTQQSPDAVRQDAIKLMR